MNLRPQLRPKVPLVEHLRPFVGCLLVTERTLYRTSDYIGNVREFVGSVGGYAFLTYQSPLPCRGVELPGVNVQPVFQLLHIGGYLVRAINGSPKVGLGVLKDGGCSCDQLGRAHLYYTAHVVLNKGQEERVVRKIMVDRRLQIHEANVLQSQGAVFSHLV